MSKVTKYKQSNGRYSVVVENVDLTDDASFFDIAAFGKTAELLNNYCSKGSKILVEGNLKQDRFTDKEGNNRSVVRVVANRIEFLDSKGNNQGQGAPKQQSNDPFANSAPDVDSDSLPF